MKRCENIVVVHQVGLTTSATPPGRLLAVPVRCGFLFFRGEAGGAGVFQVRCRQFRQGMGLGLMERP